MTTVLVLMILGVIWGFVLIPPFLQGRRENRPGDSIASFRNQLSTLQRTTPGAPRLDIDRSNVTQLASRRPQGGQVQVRAAALRRSEVRRRRREVFLTLLGAVAVTFLLAVALGGLVWVLHLLVDVAFGGYVAMLMSIQQRVAERDLKVRPMPQARRQAPPQLALRRYGS